MTSNLFSRYLIIASVIALSVLCVMGNWPVSLGIDLRGGSVLTYRIEEISGAEKLTDQSQREEAIENTLEVISNRINKEGVKDISVRREGEYIVITLPNYSADQTKKIRERMTQMGRLEMPIKAANGDVNRDGVAFDLAKFEKDRQEKKGDFKAPRDFRWIPKRPQPQKGESEEAYRKRLAEFERRARTEPWTLKTLEDYTRTEGMWFYYDPEYWDAERGLPGFTGQDILDPQRSVDSNGGRAVSYNVRNDRQYALGSYTKKYKGREIALVLNDEVWSSATIKGRLTDNVQITRGGGGYSEDEQKWLLNCLQAGSLKLKPVLESQEQVGATLGTVAIYRGEMAFVIGGVSVIAFMIGYYTFAGFLAVIALLLNFLFVFAILMLLQASLTLPGIAGLVLTVGMAVDANILIFERMREEVEKGKRLIHAAKNGFDRAFVTIFDANLTTFIVAAFLVYYGKGPIKGFGYTLMTGIVCSMFAGLYITRTLLGTALAKGWIKELKFRRLMNKPNVAFIEKAKPALLASAAMILIGMGAFLARGDEKYGLDFNGGTAVRLVFQEPMVDNDVKQAIRSIKDEAGKTKYQTVEANAIEPVDGRSKVVDIRIDYEARTDTGDGITRDGGDPYETVRRELLDTFGDKLVPESLTDVEYSSDTGKWSALVHLNKPIESPAPLKKVLQGKALKDPEVAAVDQGGLTWRISASLTPDAARDAEAAVLNALMGSDELALTHPFPKLRFAGPAVVAGLKTAAFQAMIVSLLFILAYIWFRFKEMKYGLAAAVALVHDILISLGVVVMANWSGLVQVPISLNVIAAFLTIIGYSLNDTIVVFDRIRENLGSSRGTFAEVVNRSINQTLSRTVLTSATTFFVIAAILAANYGLESPLEGLSFTLLIGVVVGTYSSIFVASPVLIWAHNRDEASRQKAGKPSKVPA